MGFLKKVLGGITDNLGGAILGGIGDFIGGAIGSHNANKTNNQNADLQREFAQNSITWRVQDAQRAGIHPLYALGASTVSATPSFVGAPTPDYGSRFQKAFTSVYDRELQKQTLEMNNLEIARKKLEVERAKQDLATSHGQNVFSTGVKSSVPVVASNPIGNAAKKTIRSDEVVGAFGDQLGARFAINRNDNFPGSWNLDPKDDYNDRMSEGFVEPFKEYLRSFHPSVRAYRAKQMTDELLRSKKISKDTVLVPKTNFNGVIPETIYVEVDRRKGTPVRIKNLTPYKFSRKEGY